MGLERKTFATREEWLAGRGRGIGASEAAAAVGMSPWMTPMQLWKLKTGADQPKDLSGNAAVQQGVRMEPAIREFFKALHPDMSIEYNPYDMLYQADRPWLYATLDGEIYMQTEGDNHELSYAPCGVLEIKTATPIGKEGWAKWADGKLPDNYYIQTIHQLLATGYDFVFLFAALYSLNGDITLREYEIQRSDVQDDLAWLLEKEEQFWNCVQTGVLPSLPLTL